MNAIEDVCGVELPGPFRRSAILYCGEWIESHAPRVHAPRTDFLGYDGAVELARDEPAAVERGLR